MNIRLFAAYLFQFNPFYSYRVVPKTLHRSRGSSWLRINHPIFFSASRAALPPRNICRTKANKLHWISRHNNIFPAGWMNGWADTGQINVKMNVSAYACVCVCPSSSDYCKPARWLAISYDNSPKAKCRASIRSVSARISCCLPFCFEGALPRGGNLFTAVSFILYLVFTFRLLVSAALSRLIWLSLAVSALSWVSDWYYSVL